MGSAFKNYISAIREAATDFNDDNAIKLSASLAYFTIFSIGPLLLVIITLMGFFYQKAAVTTQVFYQLSMLIGSSGAAELQNILDATSKLNNSTLFGIIGLIILIFGTTGVFTEIQGSINYIWSIKATPKRGWVKYITDRLLSFSLVVGIGFLMLVTLLINLLMDALVHRLQLFFGSSNVIIFQGINLVLLFSVATFLFAVIYKVLPDARISWRDALTGASVTGLFFLIGKFVIGYYIGSSKSINTYGAAASIIILLSWVYYSALILYFGAEFTKVYAMKFGQGITVYDTAVYILKREAKELPIKKIKSEEQMGNMQDKTSGSNS